MNQNVWIARHGNRLDFVRPEWFQTAQRRYDPPLSDDGRVQARQLGDRLRSENIDHIFASPFLRTVETAHAVAETLDLPVKLEWGLCEWLNADWMTSTPETQTPEMLARQFPRLDLDYRSRVDARYPETETQALSRAGQTARVLAAEFSGDLLLVGHGASVLGMARGLVGDDCYVHACLCCLVRVSRRGSQWRLERDGTDMSHLSHSEAKVRFN